LAQVPGAAPVLLASACAALALNLSIYLLIAATSALTLNVAGVRHEPSTVKCEGRAEKEEPLVVETALSKTGLVDSWLILPHDAASAPWSSTPSLPRSISLAN
jgi:hypothetical protein